MHPQYLEAIPDGNELVLQTRLGRERLRTKSADELFAVALGDLGDGGALWLAPGDYPISEPVRVPSMCSITGAGVSSRIVVAPGVTAGLILDSVDYAEVARLSVVAAGGAVGAGPADSGPAGGGSGNSGNSESASGIELIGAGNSGVRDVHVSGFAGAGVVLRGSTFLSEVRGCNLTGNRRAAVLLENLRKGRVGDFVPNLVSGCMISGGGYGVEGDGAIVVNLVGCECFQTERAAFYLYNTSNSVLISGCRTFQIETDAIVVESAHEINISSNIFCWHRGHGIVLKDVAWGTIAGNNVIDSGVRHDERKDGIRLLDGSRGIQVTGNAVFNWGDQLPMDVGIREDSSCRNNVFVGNNINFTVGEPLVSQGTGSTVAATVAEGPEAYIGMDRKGYPDFTRTRLDDYIRSRLPG